MLSPLFHLMLCRLHIDAIIGAMRTTVTLDDDVAAVVEQRCRAEGTGVSETINRLVREGLAKPKTPSKYVHRSYDMGLKIDITNIGEVMAMLDEYDRPCS